MWDSFSRCMISSDKDRYVINIFLHWHDVTHAQSVGCILGQTQMRELENARSRLSKSSIASSFGVFRHDPPLPCMPPFLLRVCWQGPDACCAPPTTSPPLPLSGCLLFFCSLLICLLSAQDVLGIIFGRPVHVHTHSANLFTWVLSSYDSLYYNP